MAFLNYSELLERYTGDEFAEFQLVARRAGHFCASYCYRSPRSRYYVDLYRKGDKEIVVFGSTLEGGVVVAVMVHHFLTPSPFVLYQRNHDFVLRRLFDSRHPLAVSTQQPPTSIFHF